MIKTAKYWADLLQLTAHPEGGWFKEVYRSGENIEKDALPARFPAKRCFSTSIYFLLEYPDFSAFHRIKSDETWHFYDGKSIQIYVLQPSGNYYSVTLGQAVEKGECLQATVPYGCWFAASPVAEGSYSLVGCTVAPGFDFSDFELGNKEQLLTLFPAHQMLIERFTR